MNFQQALAHHFPGATPEGDFIHKTYKTLNTFGFSESNTIACVGVCRDELTQPLVAKIHDAWGEAFNFSSLGGMLFLGKTGFSAAHHHAPQTNGRERYVYFAMPHIAIESDGEIGKCYRPGRANKSNACGALAAFLQEMTNGELNPEFDSLDIEQSMLKQRLTKKISYGQVPNLVQLTKLAHQRILEDLKRMVEHTVDLNISDYAILTGIQIHGPNGINFVWPGVLYAVVNKNRREIVLT